MGKTNLPPWTADRQAAYPIFARTVNPWDNARTPGGSTGGGAAALAAGLTPLELGSDMAGSIRVPAAFCGVYGHRPSVTAIPRAGHFPGAPLPNPATRLGVLGPLRVAPTILLLPSTSSPGRLLGRRSRGSCASLRRATSGWRTTGWRSCRPWTGSRSTTRSTRHWTGSPRASAALAFIWGGHSRVVSVTFTTTTPCLSHWSGPLRLPFSPLSRAAELRTQVLLNSCAGSTSAKNTEPPTALCLPIGTSFSRLSPARSRSRTRRHRSRRAPCR
jgi:hypothetical protein